MIHSLGRLGTVAGNTFREIVVHNRWFQLSLLGLMVFVLGGQSLSQLPLGPSSAKLIFDFGQSSITVGLGLVLILVLAAQRHAEVQQGIVYSYLVRRLRRSEYLAGKLLGSWLAVATAGCVALMVLALLVGQELADMAAQGLEVEGVRLAAWIQLWTVLALQWLVLGSVVVLLSTLSRSLLFPVGLSLLLWFTSLLANGTAGWSADTSSGVTRALRLFLPPFDLGTVAGELWYGGELEWGDWLKARVIEGLYAVVLFIAAAFLFGRREL